MKYIYEYTCEFRKWYYDAFDSNMNMTILANTYYEKLPGKWSNYFQEECDAPKPGGPLTTRQPAENLYISYHETHI